MINISQRIRVADLTILLWLSFLPAPIDAKDSDTSPSGDTQRLAPEDLLYLGAFRLPKGDQGGSSWAFGGSALTYYPAGDPHGPNDGFPGSLFGVGHDWHQLVAEVSIPEPVVSHRKDAADLPVAKFLQPFSDVTSGLIGTVPGDKIGGLAYLPKQGLQSTNKLYWSVLEYYNVTARTNNGHGWSELQLAQPDARGVWHLGPRRVAFHSQRTTNYLFEIPAEWADAHVGASYLAAGRAREAGSFGSSQGPTLYAFGPWKSGNPPPDGAELPAVPLLYYPERPACWEDDSCHFPGYVACDDWDGGEWITTDAREAVVIVGSKGQGIVYYGEGRPDDCSIYKGYHCTPYEGQFLFYDPNELAAVANGKAKPWKVRPYAIMKPVEYLWPDCDFKLGATAFDRERSLFYVIQKSVDTTADGNPLVHVFRIGSEQ